MTLLNRLLARKTFPHGVHPEEHKEATEDKPIRRLPFPPRMVIHLSQHTGAPAKPLVEAGQEVVRGEPIAEPGGFVSVPMHAPATGVIEEIALSRDVKGNMSPAILLKPYTAASQEVLYGREVDITSLSRDELVTAVQATGVVGLGGAAFPTHVKLAIPEGKSVDTVIVNGCECEPYLTTDHRVMVEMPEHIFKGLEIVMRALDAKVGVVGVESNKPGALAALRRVCPNGKNMRVESLVTKYPQGAEKMLLKAILNREVPSGGLPLDCGAAVFNVATLAQLGELLPHQQGLIERVVTVTGPGVGKPGNYMVPIGTPLTYVLEFCDLKEDEVGEIILGGPMMGASIASPDIPITKGITGVLVMTRAGVREAVDGAGAARPLPCIKCGNCVDACPIHLNPSQLGLLARNNAYDRMAGDYHLMDCFECGCCSYICPSRIPLVQYFRVAKAIVRQRQAARQKAGA
jgi:electron transport complex protein RnfC